MVQIQGTGFSKIDKSDTKVAGIKTFLQRKVNERLNKMTEEGKTPFGTNIGGSAVGEEGMGSFVNPKEVSTNYFSPGGGATQETKVASADLSGIDFAQNFAKGVNKEEAEKKNFFDGQKLADNTYKSTFESDVSPDYTDTYKDTLNILKKDDYKKTYEDKIKERNEIAESFGVDTTVGPTYTERDESLFGGKLLTSPFPGVKDRYITTKESLSGVKDPRYAEGSSFTVTPTKFDKGTAFQIGVTFDQNKYGLTPGLLGSGGMYNFEGPQGESTKGYVAGMLQQSADLKESEALRKKLIEKNPQNYTEDGELKTLDQAYGATVNEIIKAENEFANKAGYDSYAEYQKAREERSNRIKSEFNNNETSELNKTPKLEVKQPNVFDRTMNFLGNVTNKVLGIQPAEGSQIGPVNVKTKETTAPVGGYNISPQGKVKALQNRIEAGIKSTGIPNNVAVQGGAMSQAARDQAAINRGIRAAELTGIPSGMATQGGVTTQSAIQAGIKARQEAAEKRATDLRNMRAAQGIASGNPNVSIVGGKAIATNNTGVARAQAMAINRKISGKSISQVKAANQQSMRDAAEARHAAFKKTGVQTATARKQAAKARVQAAAKKRHAAFKAKRAAKKKSKKK